MKYTTPEIEIVKFEAMEVMAASGNTAGGNDGSDDKPSVDLG